ncbi:MAG: RNA polymerase sigma factor [Microscillaceae bacterium]|nr:RNA polymerase sigma factor [Microscillaceae bacterium]MDW8460133.1 RNA polymerase sigma factor [Cytophagales bacterium]
MSDQAILDLFQQPDTRNQAFESLIQKYQQKVYWHIRKMVIDHNDTDDLVQEVFIKIWKHLDSFKREAKLYTWIYKIATNECLRWLEKKRKKNWILIGEANRELKQKIDSGNHISGDEIQLKLQKALLTLPDKQRLVFNMKYFDDMTYEEIAEILGTSVGALKASYHLAVKKIESFLEKN